MDFALLRDRPILGARMAVVLGFFCFSRERLAKGSRCAVKYGQGENENAVARWYSALGCRGSCPRIDSDIKNWNLD